MGVWGRGGAPMDSPWNTINAKFLDPNHLLKSNGRFQACLLPIEWSRPWGSINLCLNDVTTAPQPDSSYKQGKLQIRVAIRFYGPELLVGCFKTEKNRKVGVK